MTPKQQIPTFESCKKLRELGIEIDSYFTFVNFISKDYNKWLVQSSLHYSGHTPAPTAAELLGMIPKVVNINISTDGSTLCSLVIYPKDHEYTVMYKAATKTASVPIYKTNSNLAEALAQMLIWLKENIKY